MVSVQQIGQGFAAFLDHEVLPMLPANSLQKTVLGTAMALAIRKSEDIYMKLIETPFVKMLDVVDDQKFLDLDAVRNALMINVPDSGLNIDVPLIGVLTFHKADVDKLYNYICGQAQISAQAPASGNPVYTGGITNG